MSGSRIFNTKYNLEYALNIFTKQRFFWEKLPKESSIKTENIEFRYGIFNNATLDATYDAWDEYTTFIHTGQSMIPIIHKTNKISRETSLTISDAYAEIPADKLHNITKVATNKPEIKDTSIFYPDAFPHKIYDDSAITRLLARQIINSCKSMMKLQVQKEICQKKYNVTSHELNYDPIEIHRIYYPYYFYVSSTHGGVKVHYINGYSGQYSETIYGNISISNFIIGIGGMASCIMLYAHNPSMCCYSSLLFTVAYLCSYHYNSKCVPREFAKY